jgi:hypothetical protein
MAPEVLHTRQVPDAVRGPVRRYVGGMNLARAWYGLRRFNATVPLAVMLASAEAIEIRAIWPLGRILPSVKVAREEVAAVYLSRAVILTPGVAVETTAGCTHYFWTWRGSALVSQLSEMGYPMGTPRRPSLLVLLGLRSGGR